MSVDALEAGDETFVKPFVPIKSPPGIDYHCAKCGKPIAHDQWTATVTEAKKLELTVTCHGESVSFLMYLGIGGTLFGDD
jgi:DNA-directed RNA polymerase subunit RPC12/RpoP